MFLSYTQRTLVSEPGPRTDPEVIVSDQQPLRASGGSVHDRLLTGVVGRAEGHDLVFDERSFRDTMQEEAARIVRLREAVRGMNTLQRKGRGYVF